MSNVETYTWLRGTVPDGPPILYCRDWQYKGMVSTELQELPVVFICHFPQVMEPRHLVAQYERLAKQFPNWHIFVSHGNPRQVRLAKHSHVIFWSDALLTRTDFWQPMHDGLFYNGVTSGSWESHTKFDLLRDVDRMLLITPLKTEFRERADKIKSLLDRNYFVSLRASGWKDPEIVRSYYAQSYCGVSVSDLDNGERMLSEFQLMGLPIVVTPQRTGLLNFSDLEFVRLVPEVPAAVASAVNDFEVRAYEPEVVREAYLDRLQEGRLAFTNRFGFIDWENFPLTLPEGEPGLWPLPQ